MWLQFFAQNAHFAIGLFAALVCTAIAWLYFDAWTFSRARKEILNWVGFALLAVSFLAQATVIEQSVLGESLFSSIATTIILAGRIAGYTFIIIGQLVDPLMKVPENKGLALEGEMPEGPEVSTPVDNKDSAETEKDNKAHKVGSSKKAAAVFLPSLTGKLLLPIGGLVVAALYWRRATTGLERHLKRVAIGFFLVGLADLVGLASLLRETSNPVVYSWVKAFGWVWALEQVLLLAGMVVLGIWVWSYLTKRFLSQLFMVFVTASVVIFLAVSVGFTSLLLRSIREDSLHKLDTASRVLNYAMGAKQAETAAGAQQLAGTSDIANAIMAADHNTLVNLTKTYLVEKKQSSLMITDDSGKVLLRAEDNARWGDAVSSDPLVVRAMLGSNASSVDAKQGAEAPIVEVRSIAVVRNKVGNIVGTVTAGLELDTAFIDGIKRETGLQSSIYGGDTLASTTLVAPDGQTRSTGIVMADKNIKDTVLKHGKTYSGNFDIQNRHMLGVFMPVKDVDNVPVGMLMAAEPQNAVLAVAGRSIELTFLLTAGLLLLSIFPAYLVSRTLERQLE
jgi:hypothetical protein